MNAHNNSGVCVCVCVCAHYKGDTCWVWGRFILWDIGGGSASDKLRDKLTACDVTYRYLVVPRSLCPQRMRMQQGRNYSIHEQFDRHECNVSYR